MNFKNLMSLVSFLVLVVSITACGDKLSETANESIEALPLDSIKAITHDAYIYGFPMVDNYRVQYDYYVDQSGKEFKAPWNQIANIARVFTSEDVAVQTPNSDTPYSWLGYDLRNEPIVLSLPEIDESRYYDVQFVDGYTFNFDYLGSRTSGNKAGIYMLVGPNWNGDAVEGIDRVLKSETELGTIVFRTQLLNPEDINNVQEIQSKYKVQTLSSYLGKDPIAATTDNTFLKPISAIDQKTSLEFFNIMNFVMNFCPTHPSEAALLERFSKIGIGAGKTIDFATLSPEVKGAMEAGVKEVWEVTFPQEIMTKINKGELTSGDVFGTRSFLNNNYLYRMTGCVLGIYGNSKEEAIYPLYREDSEGNKLDATTNKYTLCFKAGELPPVNAFWSLTMYNLPQSLLVANPINRYLINSPMLPELKKDKDGGITFYIQNESPGKDKKSNWLPAPKGPFWTVLRLYWPKPEAYNGTWKNPEMNLIK